MKLKKIIRLVAYLTTLLTVNFFFQFLLLKVLVSNTYWFLDFMAWIWYLSMITIIALEAWRTA
jgi:hypothetical protein